VRTPTARAPRARDAGPPAAPVRAEAPAASPAPWSRTTSVAVESFEDLARLAEQRGLAVLWVARDGVDEYRVIDDDVTYRYALGEPPALPAEEPAADQPTDAEPPALRALPTRRPGGGRRRAA